MTSAEHRLGRPKGRSPHQIPIGRLWCTLELVTGPGGLIVRAAVTHEAKAYGKWSCTFAEKALLVGLTGDHALATEILSRVELADLRKGSRSTTEGALQVTRRTEEGNGDVTVVVAK